jgi:hypothetical protein
MALVRTDGSEELRASFIRVTRIGELGTTLMKEALSSSETSVLTRATRRNIPEDSILNCTYPCRVFFLRWNMAASWVENTYSLDELSCLSPVVRFINAAPAVNSWNTPMLLLQDRPITILPSVTKDATVFILKFSSDVRDICYTNFNLDSRTADKKTPWLSVRKRTVYTGRSQQPAKLVLTFSGRGWCMVKAMVPHGR